MSLKVLRPGLLSTIQDLGRYGYQQYGVVVGGVMDSFSHRLANLLVGNEEQTATLEMTMLGPVIQLEEDTVLAITGADLAPTLDGMPVPLWRTVYAKKGTKLSFKGGTKGCRAYLAVGGGFKLPKALGSRSTYLRAGIGGFQGRTLQAGDSLEYGDLSKTSVKILRELSRKEDSSFTYYSWGITPSLIPSYRSTISVRVIAGREADLFTEASKKLFLSTPFEITNQSDRMGYRLEGEKLSLTRPVDMISAAVTFGTVQVPPEGNPIVLMADRQTTGGYPKIAQIISIDLPAIAQARPGDKVIFEEVSLKDAQELLLLREKEITQIKLGISLQLGKEV